MSTEPLSQWQGFSASAAAGSSSSHGGDGAAYATRQLRMLKPENYNRHAHASSRDATGDRDAGSLSAAMGGGNGDRGDKEKGKTRRKVPVTMRRNRSGSLSVGVSRRAQSSVDKEGHGAGGGGNNNSSSSHMNQVNMVTPREDEDAGGVGSSSSSSPYGVQGFYSRAVGGGSGGGFRKPQRSSSEMPVDSRGLPLGHGGIFSQYYGSGVPPMNAGAGMLPSARPGTGNSDAQQQQLHQRRPSSSGGLTDRLGSFGSGAMAGHDGPVPGNSISNSYSSYLQPQQPQQPPYGMNGMASGPSGGGGGMSTASRLYALRPPGMRGASAHENAHDGGSSGNNNLPMRGAPPVRYHSQHIISSDRRYNAPTSASGGGGGGGGGSSSAITPPSPSRDAVNSGHEGASPPGLPPPNAFASAGVGASGGSGSNRTGLLRVKIFLDDGGRGGPAHSHDDGSSKPSRYVLCYMPRILSYATFENRVDKRCKLSPFHPSKRNTTFGGDAAYGGGGGGGGGGGAAAAASADISAMRMFYLHDSFLASADVSASSSADAGTTPRSADYNNNNNNNSARNRGEGVRLTLAEVEAACYQIDARQFPRFLQLACDHCRDDKTELRLFVTYTPPSTTTGGAGEGTNGSGNNSSTRGAMTPDPFFQPPATVGGSGAPPRSGGAFTMTVATTSSPNKQLQRTVTTATPVMTSPSDGKPNGGTTNASHTSSSGMPARRHHPSSHASSSQQQQQQQHGTGLPRHPVEMYASGGGVSSALPTPSALAAGHHHHRSRRPYHTDTSMAEESTSAETTDNDDDDDDDAVNISPVDRSLTPPGQISAGKGSHRTPPWAAAAASSGSTRDAAGSQQLQQQSRGRHRHARVLAADTADGPQVDNGISTLEILRKSGSRTRLPSRSHTAHPTGDDRNTSREDGEDGGEEGSAKGREATGASGNRRVVSRTTGATGSGTGSSGSEPWQQTFEALSRDVVPWANVGIIGKGAFGTVYEGIIARDNCSVINAVTLKHLVQQQQQQEEKLRQQQQQQPSSGAEKDKAEPKYLHVAVKVLDLNLGGFTPPSTTGKSGDDGGDGLGEFGGLNNPAVSHVKKLIREINLMRRHRHENIVSYIHCQICEKTDERVGERFEAFGGNSAALVGRPSSNGRPQPPHPAARGNPLCHPSRRFLQVEILMELCPGGTLTDQVKRAPGHRLPVVLARKYIRDILNGLVFLHGRGVIHRDIKPDNVLISADGTAKLADFGCSRRIADAAATSTMNSMAPNNVNNSHGNNSHNFSATPSAMSTLTGAAAAAAGGGAAPFEHLDSILSRWDSVGTINNVAHTMVGTPLFMAPEVVQADIDLAFGGNESNGSGGGSSGNGPAPGASLLPSSSSASSQGGYAAPADIWAVGCLTLQLFGRTPWPLTSSTTPFQIMLRIAQADPNSLPPGVPAAAPAALRFFLAKCLQRQPSRRATARELLRTEWMTCPDSDLREVP